MNAEFDHIEHHATIHNSRTNWLRAAVLGANDGIVSVAALVVGVAGATTETGTLIITGVAGLLSGALSMAAGEYVSVSSQRDIEEALLRKERRELEESPEAELEELASIYQAKGVSRETALTVARELTAHDAFAAHVDAELHIDPDNLTSPVAAAFASAASFTVGAIIPVLAIVLPPEGVRIPIAFVASFIALAGTGYWSAHVSDAPRMRATVRVVLGGIAAMIVTFGIGLLFGVSAG
jgi:VIT1/CCC1 family predicted Fe2+/Mn2+ transporter